MAISENITTVDTPLPETEDGSGYRTEESERIEYTAGNTRVLVRRVGERGWSIWHYSDDDMRRIDKELDGFEAKRLGRRTIEEVAE